MDILPQRRVLRQHRTEIVVQMRSQILRQIVHKFRRHTDVCQEICVQDAGKYASRCAAKPSGGLCAVLPITFRCDSGHVAEVVSDSVQGRIYSPLHLEALSLQTMQQLL